jgi:hypothetical protein
MGGMLGALHDATVRPFQDAVTRMAADAATGLAIVLLASLGAGFAIAAACIWLTGLLGALAACGILAGAFLVAAGIIIVVHRAGQARRQRKADEEAARRRAAQASLGMAAFIGEQLTRVLAGSGAKDQIAPSPAHPRARRSNPWFLLALAVAGGFASARLLADDGDADH